MDITGARWSLEGAEAILRLRSDFVKHEVEKRFGPQNITSRTSTVQDGKRTTVPGGPPVDARGDVVNEARAVASIDLHYPYRRAAVSGAPAVAQLSVKTCVRETTYGGRLRTWFACVAAQPKTWRVPDSRPQRVRWQIHALRFSFGM